ncbi:hypothetical protein [Leekyejoonella antrihumi]|uniref:Uncharacterized protein n=1 Tax=Leekyejoonella antrihumi TaxID=1660198 RepID=A0A563E8A5_9MICO|nr:hypothetical protein [Leekyejoonella antrihumi]TWP38483.1 hypothetical protein FGL98_01400 [Leekyejoonella antrihumi]
MESDPAETLRVQTPGANKQKSINLLNAINAAPTPAAEATALKAAEDFAAQNVLSVVPYAMAQRTEIWSKNVHGYTADQYSARTALKTTWVSK